MAMARPVVVATGLAVAACLFWGFYLEPASLRVEETQLSLAWPYARPLRVAVVSDLHVGSPYQSLPHLHEIVDRINGTRPDLICLLGDFVTVGVIGGRHVAPELVSRELSRLRAPAGVTAVLGNHDRAREMGRMVEALRSAGIRVLEDTAAYVLTPSGPLWIAGVSDLWSGHHDITRALGFVPAGTHPIILITHNPDIFPDVPARVLLSLAGHTHGGQVRLPVVGAPIVPSRYGQRYVGGHVRERGRDLFVTTGVGTSGIPVRFGVPPVISLLTISRGAGAADSGESRPQTAPETR